MSEKIFTCDYCNIHGCSTDDEYPIFCPTKKIDQESIDKIVNTYKNNDFFLKLMRVSSEIEAENYLKATRVEETIKFIKKMKFNLVGIAACISLLPEARAFGNLLESHNIDYRVICCKVGTIDKGELGVPDKNRLRPENDHESMCNPILQAKYLENQNVDLAILMGLCVGHDSLFHLNTKLPTTTLIVKDRVTCHSPAAPLHYTDRIYSKLYNK